VVSKATTGFLDFIASLTSSDTLKNELLLLKQFLEAVHRERLLVLQNLAAEVPHRPLVCQIMFNNSLATIFYMMLHEMRKWKHLLSHG